MAPAAAAAMSSEDGQAVRMAGAGGSACPLRCTAVSPTRCQPHCLRPHPPPPTHHERRCCTMTIACCSATA